MKFPVKIALRYIFTIRKFQFITFISVLSSLGITIGVAALIIVTSLFNGFREFARKEIIGVEPHIRIYLKENSDEVSKQLMKFCSKNYNAILYPFVTFKAIAEKNQNTRVVQFFLIEDSVFAKHPIAGKLVLNIGTGKSQIFPNNSVIVGIGLADAMRVLPGESFWVLTIEDIDFAIANFTLPSKRQVLVGSIFQTNNSDYDFNYIFAEKSVLGSFVDPKRVVKGLDVRLSSVELVEQVASELRKMYPNLPIFTWYDLNKDVMNAMQFEKYAVFIILSLIISIAVFNILASLFMTVLEKKSDIAILLTLGAKEKEVRSIFQMQGLFIGAISTFVGFIFGLGFTLGQIKFGWIKLNTQKYVVSALPMEISIPTIIAIVLVSLLLSYLATIYPSMKASKINVAEAIFRE